MREEYYELTAPQKSIWLTEQYYKNTNVNNVCGTFYSSEKLDFELLKRALNIFLKNNDSFKIKLKLVDDEVKQYFSKLDDIDFEIIDLKNKEDQTALEEKVDSIVFNIMDSLLFKIVLFRYPDGHGGFIINSHHIISDSWTNGITANDVAFIYAKLKNGEDYIKDESLSYKTYIQSEKDYINSNKFEKDKLYWNDLFGTIPEVATIPSIKDNKKDDDVSANRLLLNLDVDTFAKIKTYCDNNKVSLYNFFMSVFSLYLGRVSGLDEFVIGTPILNRTNFKEKQTTGMFINTLPLKISLDHQKTFLANLKDIAVNSMSLLRHQKYSFQYIIEDLRKRDSSLPKLYDVVYSYQITKMNENMDSLNHKTSWTFNKSITDDLDIHMFEWNENNSIQIAYDYKISKYDEQDIKDIHARILHVINQVLDDENILLKDLEIVTPEEKHKILYEFNNTKVDYPKDKTIVDLFEEQVEKTPDNIAVVFENQQLTYRELNEKSNQLANKILNLKLTNNYICILCDKSLEMIIGMLAILKSGNCYIPIDPSSPTSRIELIIKSSNSPLLLVGPNYKEKYSNYNILTISNYDESTDYINLSSLNNSAYIIFTSGTTGTPKGVEVLHKNIINTLNWRKNLYNFNSLTKVLQLPSFAFDSSVEDIFTALISGSTLIIPSYKINDINNLILDIKKHNISHFLITPALYKIFLESDCKEISSLEFITVAGEAFSTDLVKKHFEIFPNVKLFNEYGPTENSVCSTVYEFTKSTEKIYIGTPISNTKAYVLSKSGNLLPIGCPGELCFSGDGIVKGYFNNLELTKEKFVVEADGTRIYKTGDIATWSMDGNLEFIGRIDHQVKIRGFRIELGEIDSNILTYPEIIQSISIVKSINNRKFIVSYIVANSKIDINKLKEYLAQKLTSYMVPNFVVQVDSLPLNINGKIDRNKLPDPVIENLDKKVEVARNNIDYLICNTLNKILNIEHISISDNVFDIGLDSLSAIQLSNIITSNLNIQISVKDIFEHSIIKELSDYISSISARDNKTTISVAKKQSYYPLSSAQKRIYYSSNINKDSILYNTAGGIILDNYLDINKLNKCFETLIYRHDSLRTSFNVIDDEIVQIIDDKVDFSVELGKSNDKDLNRVYSEFVKPFDLSTAPLFRVKLIDLDNNKQLLMLDMHHIISDGTSLGILLQELCDLYNDIELENKLIDYKDFTLWEKEQFETDEFNKSKEYWINQFKDEIPLLNMPTTSSRPSVQSFEGSNWYANLDKETYTKINDLSKKLNITPYMLLLSVYYILLSKYCSQDDIIIGTPISGRNMPELSNIIGMFVNTLALRNKVDHSISFKQFSKNIKEYCLSAFNNQQYPFDELVRELNINRDTSRNPLFDVMFIFQNNGYPEVNFNNIKTKYYIPSGTISKFDLSLEIIPIDNEYHLRFEYCTSLFDENFIKRFSSHYINILNTILDNTDIKISDIDMLSIEEKNQILYEFNNTKVNYSRDKTIVDLFEEQVKKTPNNIAIIFEDKKLTYKELNEKANQLARYLDLLGMSSNSTIGIMLPRSMDILISILAVLKVGASYIPIDPTLPKERIEYMLQNSRTSLLIKVSHSKSITFENYINIDNPDIYTNSKNNINKYIDLELPAYTIYTSGSTGNPKGVTLKHKALLNLTNYLNKTVRYLSSDIEPIAIASITTISFDIFIFETLISLQRGLKVVLANEEEQTSPSSLDYLISTHNIKAIQMTPSRMEVFINNKAYMPNLGNLDYIVLAGEALSDKLKNKILSLGNITIYNGYGPSETTVFSTFTDVTDFSKVTIGKPIDNTYMYVLDKDFHLCPFGVPGELYISGDGVGLGYLNNNELTNSSFVKDIFNDNLTMYKTGDLVRCLPDLQLDYIGRLDNQVKIRGLRIELDEIQKWISQYDNVKNVIVFPNKDKNDRQYIVAYLTVSNRISINNLKIYLSHHIPKYMIPTHFIILDDFPYLPNGKINKKALPLANEYNIITKEYAAPSNNLEKEICKVFERLLSISPISIDDNFFDIGGDSLLAMSLQLELLKLNININYSDIFMYPTIRELAQSISNFTKKSCQDINFEEFSKFNTILQHNLDYKIPTYSCPGNILLAGVTGFLGAHILDSFIKNETGKIYCLIRTEPGLTIEQKLINKLHYYFDTKYDDLIGTRIIPIKSDISINTLGLTETELLELSTNINVVINSAAMVSHYGNYIDYKKANVDTTQNLINFCMEYKKTFYQISTLSVSGNSIARNSNIKQEFNESDFYINQSLDNVYVRSKFEAEKLVFENISKGLNAYILRVGNLMSRFLDGKFQPNVNENAFINRLLAYFNIECIPESLSNTNLEFTPVDYCADSIIKIIQYSNSINRVFHLFNHKYLSTTKLIDVFNKFYGKIKIVNNDHFSKIINKLLNDVDNNNALSGLVSDLNKNELKPSSEINIKSDFTIQYLYNINFEWPNLDEEYIIKFLSFLDNLNLFKNKKGEN